MDAHAIDLLAKQFIERLGKLAGKTLKDLHEAHPGGVILDENIAADVEMLQESLSEDVWDLWSESVGNLLPDRERETVEDVALWGKNFSITEGVHGVSIFSAETRRVLRLRLMGGRFEMRSVETTHAHPALASLGELNPNDPQSVDDFIIQWESAPKVHRTNTTWDDAIEREAWQRLCWEHFAGRGDVVGKHGAISFLDNGKMRVWKDRASSEMMEVNARGLKQYMSRKWWLGVSFNDDGASKIAPQLFEAAFGEDVPDGATIAWPEDRLDIDSDVKVLRPDGALDTVSRIEFHLDNLLEVFSNLSFDTAKTFDFNNLHHPTRKYTHNWLWLRESLYQITRAEEGKKVSQHTLKRSPGYHDPGTPSVDIIPDDISEPIIRVRGNGSSYTREVQLVSQKVKSGYVPGLDKFLESDPSIEDLRLYLGGLRKGAWFGDRGGILIVGGEAQVWKDRKLSGIYFRGGDKCFHTWAKRVLEQIVQDSRDHKDLLNRIFADFETDDVSIYAGDPGDCFLYRQTSDGYAVSRKPVKEYWAWKLYQAFEGLASEEETILRIDEDIPGAVGGSLLSMTYSIVNDKDDVNAEGVTAKRAPPWVPEGLDLVPTDPAKPVLRLRACWKDFHRKIVTIPRDEYERGLADPDALGDVVRDVRHAKQAPPGLFECVSHEVKRLFNRGDNAEFAYTIGDRYSLAVKKVGDGEILYVDSLNEGWGRRINIDGSLASTSRDPNLTTVAQTLVPYMTADLDDFLEVWSISKDYSAIRKYIGDRDAVLGEKGAVLFLPKDNRLYVFEDRRRLFDVQVFDVETKETWNSSTRWWNIGVEKLTEEFRTIAALECVVTVAQEHRDTIPFDEGSRFGKSIKIIQKAASAGTLPNGYVVLHENTSLKIKDPSGQALHFTPAAKPDAWHSHTFEVSKKIDTDEFEVERLVGLVQAHNKWTGEVDPTVFTQYSTVGKWVVREVFPGHYAFECPEHKDIYVAHYTAGAQATVERAHDWILNFLRNGESGAYETLRWSMASCFEPLIHVSEKLDMYRDGDRLIVWDREREIDYVVPRGGAVEANPHHPSPHYPETSERIIGAVLEKAASWSLVGNLGRYTRKLAGNLPNSILAHPTKDILAHFDGNEETHIYARSYGEWRRGANTKVDNPYLDIFQTHVAQGGHDDDLMIQCLEQIEDMEIVTHYTDNDPYIIEVPLQESGSWALIKMIQGCLTERVRIVRNEEERRTSILEMVLSDPDRLCDMEWKSFHDDIDASSERSDILRELANTILEIEDDQEIGWRVRVRQCDAGEAIAFEDPEDGRIGQVLFQAHGRGIFVDWESVPGRVLISSRAHDPDAALAAILQSTSLINSKEPEGKIVRQYIEENATYTNEHGHAYAVATVGGETYGLCAFHVLCGITRLQSRLPIDPDPKGIAALVKHIQNLSSEGARPYDPHLRVKTVRTLSALEVGDYTSCHVKGVTYLTPLWGESALAPAIVAHPDRIYHNHHVNGARVQHVVPIDDQGLVHGNAYGFGDGVLMMKVYEHGVLHDKRPSDGLQELARNGFPVFFPKSNEVLAYTGDHGTFIHAPQGSYCSFTGDRAYLWEGEGDDPRSPREASTEECIAWIQDLLERASIPRERMREILEQETRQHQGRLSLRTRDKIMGRALGKLIPHPALRLLSALALHGRVPERHRRAVEAVVAAELQGQGFKLVESLLGALGESPDQGPSLLEQIQVLEERDRRRGKSKI